MRGRIGSGTIAGRNDRRLGSPPHSRAVSTAAEYDRDRRHRVVIRNTSHAADPGLRELSGMVRFVPTITALAGQARYDPTVTEHHPHKG